MAGRQTLIPNGTRVAGRIDAEGDVLLVGRVEGAIRAEGAVIISAPGVAVAEITATRIEVQGVVIGNLIAMARIEVGPEARIIGDLRAPEVEITSGAVIDGRIDRFAAPPSSGPPPPLDPGKTTLRMHGDPLVRPARPSAEMPVIAGESADEPPSTDPPRAEPHAPSLPRPPSRARLSTRRRKGTLP